MSDDTADAGPAPAQPAIRLLGDLQRIPFAPGDKFVLSITADDGALSAEQMERIQAIWRTFAGDEYPLLILPKGFELRVVRTGANP